MLQNVKFLPCRYRNQQKSWMDWNLFEEWLRELDRKFAFVINNCPAHDHIDNLKGIKLYFLPPNTTSKTQPMDQGVIRSLKAKYRKKCCPEDYSKSWEEENLSKNFFTARNANVSLSLGWNIGANHRELLSKVRNIHRKPVNCHRERLK